MKIVLKSNRYLHNFHKTLVLFSRIQFRIWDKLSIVFSLSHFRLYSYGLHFVWPISKLMEINRINLSQFYKTAVFSASLQVSKCHLIRETTIAFHTFWLTWILYPLNTGKSWNHRRKKNVICLCAHMLPAVNDFFLLTHSKSDTMLPPDEVWSCTTQKKLLD